MSFPWAKQYEPTNAVTKFLDEKLPLPRLVYNAVGAGYPVPRNLSYFWNFGVLAGFCLVLQIVTGVVLAMHYAANAGVAFDSVEHIMRDVNWGWLMRYAHANGASAFFVVVYLHIFRGFFYSSYKAPREMIWLIGVTIFLLMMATAFMGYVLPWGQMSFWGATVITNLFSAIPGVGDWIVTLLWGGFSVDNPTLNRFFSLHYLLPFVILGVVVLHVIALHRFGSNNPIGIDTKGPQDTIPFHPYYTVKDLFGLGVFLIFYAYWVFYAPVTLGDPVNFVPANPLSTPEHIVPEWYFLPFYAILRSIPDKLIGVLAMFAAIAVLFVLPWLDRSPVRSGRYRPAFKLFFWMLVFDCAILTICGKNPPDWLWNPFTFTIAPESPEHGGISIIAMGQLATAYYFGYFLVVLPLLSIFEKALPVPLSISRPVLGAGGSHAAIAQAPQQMEKF